MQYKHCCGNLSFYFPTTLIQKLFPTLHAVKCPNSHSDMYRTCSVTFQTECTVFDTQLPAGNFIHIHSAHPGRHDLFHLGVLYFVGYFSALKFSPIV